MGVIPRLTNSIPNALPVIELALDKIRVKEENNLRRYSPNAKKIEELARSIREGVLLQPLVVKEAPGEDGCSHELVAGYQRYKALAFNQEVKDQGPVLARVVENTEVVGTGEGEGEKGNGNLDQLLQNLEENVERNELTLIDSCFAARRLKDLGMSQKEIAKRFRKSDSWVSRVIRFGDLRPALQKRIHEGEIPYKVAIALLEEDEAGQDELIAQVDAVGPGGAKSAVADRKKKKGKKRGGNTAQDRTADGRGLSAKAAIKAFEENAEKVGAVEKPTKLDNRVMDVYANLIKLMTGAIGVKAFHNRLMGVLG